MPRMNPCAGLLTSPRLLDSKPESSPAEEKLIRQMRGYCLIHSPLNKNRDTGVDI